MGASAGYQVDIEAALTALGVQRPVFHSEADFQHALAWRISSAHPEVGIRLEVPRSLAGRRIHVDIWIVGPERVAIELKYLTRAISHVVQGETFELRNQGAQDIGRYDVLKDLERVERLVAGGMADRGFVVTLTNDPTYWSGPHRLLSPNYEAFRLSEGCSISGTLAWGPATGAGTMRGRESPISLAGFFECHWASYSSLGAMPGGEFRYLLWEVITARQERV